MVSITFNDFQTFLWLDRTTPKMSKEALKCIFEYLKNEKNVYSLVDVVENFNFKEISREEINGDFKEFLEHLQKSGWAKETSRGVVYQIGNIAPSDFTTSRQRRAESRKHLKEEYENRRLENSNNN